VLQHTATLQYSASLPYTATYCNTIQHCNTHEACSTCQLIGERARTTRTPTFFAWCLPGILCNAHCTTLQHTATHCNTLQHTATHCNTLQYRIILFCEMPTIHPQLVRCDAAACVLQCVAVCYNVLQCVAVCCSVLHCVAVCFNAASPCVCCDAAACVLQCAAVCYSVLQCIAVCCSVCYCMFQFGEFLRARGAVWCSVVQRGVL